MISWTWSCRSCATADCSGRSTKGQRCGRTWACGCPEARAQRLEEAMLHAKSTRDVRQCSQLGQRQRQIRRVPAISHATIRTCRQTSAHGTPAGEMSPLPRSRNCRQRPRSPMASAHNPGAAQSWGRYWADDARLLPMLWPFARIERHHGSHVGANLRHLGQAQQAGRQAKCERDQIRQNREGSEVLSGALKGWSNSSMAEPSFREYPGKNSARWHMSCICDREPRVERT